MELSLPILDGLEVASLLKDESGTNDIALVGVTGCGDLPRIRRALDTGFSAVLLKPCPPQELATELCRVLRVTAWSPRWFRLPQRQEPLSLTLRREAAPPPEMQTADGLALRDAARSARPLFAVAECPLCTKRDGLYRFRWNSVLWHRCVLCGAVWRWDQTDGCCP